jgi:hypothetical protein
MEEKIFGLLAAGLLAGPIAARAMPSDAPADFLGTLDVTCVGYSAADCGTGGVVGNSRGLLNRFSATHLPVEIFLPLASKRGCSS